MTGIDKETRNPYQFVRKLTKADILKNQVRRFFSIVELIKLLCEQNKPASFLSSAKNVYRYLPDYYAATTHAEG
jgi:hypothetical protein